MKLNTKKVPQTSKLICFLGHLIKKKYHTIHILYQTNEIKEVQNKENAIIRSKKIIEINGTVVIKKNVFYMIAVLMSLQVSLIQKTHTRFGHCNTYKMINLSADIQPFLQSSMFGVNQFELYKDLR